MSGVKRYGMVEYEHGEAMTAGYMARLHELLAMLATTTRNKR